MCYTIYLYHYVIISLVGKLTVHFSLGHNYAINFALQVLLVVPFVIVACSALFVSFERPFMRKDWPAKSLAKLRRRPVLRDKWIGY